MICWKVNNYGNSGEYQVRRDFVKKNIKDVEEWIDKNIDSGINSADVVKVSGYSRSYFLREFSTEKNITVSCYIRLLRLELASKLLTNTDLSVKEISKKLILSQPEFILSMFQETLPYFTHRI